MFCSLVYVETWVLRPKVDPQLPLFRRVKIYSPLSANIKNCCPPKFSVLARAEMWSDCVYVNLNIYTHDIAKMCKNDFSFLFIIIIFKKRFILIYISLYLNVFALI